MTFPVRVKFIIRSRPTEAPSLAGTVKAAIPSSVDIETNSFNVTLWAHTDADGVAVMMALSDQLHSMSWFEDTGQGFVLHRIGGPAQIFWRGPNRVEAKTYDLFGLNMDEDSYGEIASQGLTDPDDILKFLTS